MFEAEGEPSRVLFWPSLFFAIGVLLPLLFVVYSLKTKTLSDWDVTNLKERPRIISVFFICWLSVALVTYFQNAPNSFFLFGLTITILLGFYLIISLFWKISIHVGIAT